MASVSFRGVYKRYAGDVVAVKDLNIEVADKEFLVLVGPSGCGKTTSLRMLAGLEEISEGEILIGDRVVNNIAPKDRDIAMVFQSYALYPHMTVYENMAFGLRLRKVPRDEIDRRVRETAKSLMIDQLLDRKPRQLSGGQRQRVAVGRAIVREPQVFLMDEPLSNLDAKLRVEARAFISKLHQRLGTTFIYVTHDQVEAMTMGTRIAVMSAGELQQIDTPQNLYDHPANVFVAGFIGSPSMNFFEGSRLVQEDGKLYVLTQSYKIPVPDKRYERYRSHVGQEVIFGIRPESIQI
ncbi:MAG: sn-glycerol-3-phosphate ABC transporter ATP-binding protein UgpC, partial [Aggregatilineales bacterium]